MRQEPILTRGRYVARFAETEQDLLAAQRLRYLAFRSRQPISDGLDADRFDTDCAHVLVEEAGSDRLVCCFRLMQFPNGSDIERSYSAQAYDLSALGRFSGCMTEVGRFCIHPDWRDPDILRVAWGALTAFVDRERVELLFGCASFQGTDAGVYADSFALLHDRYIAPERWLPRVKAPRVVEFANDRTGKADMKLAQSRMPPLLRTYLLMGGWVSDHAVVDSGMNTLHVFTGLEIGAVPAERARLLRAVAG